MAVCDRKSLIVATTGTCDLNHIKTSKNQKPKSEFKMAVLPTCMILFLLSNFGNSFLNCGKWQPNAKLDIRLLRLSSSPEGKIFQFQGKSPPPELARLFGISVEEKEKRSLGRKKIAKVLEKVNKSQLPAKPSNPPQQPPPTIKREKRDKRAKKILVDEESVLDLEKDVLQKYGSSAFKDALVDDDDDDDWGAEDGGVGKRKRTAKFEGFGGRAVVGSLQRDVESSMADSNEAEKVVPRMGRGKSSEVAETFSKPSIFSRLKRTSARAIPDDDEITGVRGMDEGQVLARSPPRGKNAASYGDTSAFTYPDDDDVDVDLYDDDKDDVEDKVRSAKETILRSGPLNAPSGYRLRPPREATPAEKQLAAKKEAAKLKIAEEKQTRRDLKRKEEKNEFFEFTFNTTSPTDDAMELLKVFSTKSFESVGVTNPTVLRNLGRMGAYNPTRVQELAIPLLTGSRDVLMQAQTGSGKTLAFLLPLVGVLDPSLRKVRKQ